MYLNSFSEDPLQPTLDLPTVDLDVLEAEDIMLENTIKSEVNNSDFFDSTEVAYVACVYLRHITNDFQKEGSIGKGGFSEVYKGVTRQSAIPLAIKRLNSNSDEERKIMNFEGNKYDGYFYNSFSIRK